ncbi:MAG: ATP-binding protein [Desulfatitalea sp.]
MTVRGFRTKIALNVAFLVLLSAIFTDVLVVLIVQGVLVRNRLHQERTLMETAGRLVLDRPPGSALSPTDALAQGEWTAVLMVDARGRHMYAIGDETYTLPRLTAGTAAALASQTIQYDHMGLIWAVFWWHPRAVLVSVPVGRDGLLLGAMASVVPLAPVYDKLRQYNKPVFIYILINTVVLSFVGLYRIFRIYLRPIDRIIHQADDYGRDEDLFFTFRQEDNELNRLSSALNRMLQRITEDRQKLKESVTCLEKANAELKRAQNEIIRAEKMASVGRLAAGIAHEIGNPIGIVLGYLDLLKQPDLQREELDDFTRRAEKEIQRINTVIRQLLDLARPKEEPAQIVAVHAVIQDIVQVMAHQPMMADIRLKTRLEAVDDQLWADADQLRQVFLNLLLNAGDAIRAAGRMGDGHITISTASAQGPPPREEKGLTIRFEDNGEGIAPDQIETIFDPFYTTKEPGKGTGLGLAVSYMIIQKLGGTIRVESQPGHGTTLVIHLPLSRLDASPGASPEAVDDASENGHGRPPHNPL